jgi:isopropylmalate/homocitrate/citramalate synthase
MEYAQLRGTFDGMDPTVITEIARYFERELGYEIPPMTPFVGSAFNLTRAGIHADGLMKDAEIYNVFDTEKILNRTADVAISNTSGVAGIAYWVNRHYSLSGDAQATKKDEWIVKIKSDIDGLYADGRTTLMGDLELEELVARYRPDLVADSFEAGR